METTNKTLTITDLESVFNQAIGLGVNYIGVEVKSPELDETEIIINPSSNFDSKLDYYKRAYNDDLTLKNCNQIQIVGFEYGDSFAEIQDWLVR